jgi:hypothetical protein
MAETKMMNSAGTPKLAATNGENKTEMVGGSMRRKRRTGRRGKKNVTMGGYKKRMNMSSRKRRRRRRGGGEVMGLESKSSLGSSNVGN